MPSHVPPLSLSRRQFLTASAAALALSTTGSALAAETKKGKAAPGPGATISQADLGMWPRKKIPIGLELYSVRGELAKNVPDTLRAVAKMGYECGEFYSPYFAWSFGFAKDVRLLMDDLGLRCYSTHNGANTIIDPGSLAKVIELNQILGTRHIISASAPRGPNTVDGWKRNCELFSAAVETLKSHGLSTGYHNHGAEWKPLEGDVRVMDILAKHTPPEFILQLDVGTAVEAGVDTVAWVKANPGRIRSMHLKDWAPGTKEEGKSYRVLFGEGVAPWKELIAAAESVGGIEVFLIEQEGSRFSEIEGAQRCLDSWRKLRAGA